MTLRQPLTKVVVIDADEYEKNFPPSLYAKSSKVLSEDETSTKNHIASLVAPSTDTTISTRTTKIDDQQNETEMFLLELDDSSDIDVPKDCNDETCSVSSSTSSVFSRYFEPTDFLPWEELYSKAEYAPHVGFAMVAGGFACMHPFVFFAGVVTAVGAVRAAGATYEYAMCMQQQDTTQSLGIDASEVNDLVIPCDCFNALGFNDAANKTTGISPIHSESGNADPVPALTKSCSTCSTNESTMGEESVKDVITKTESANAPGSTIPSVIKSFREETFDPNRWVGDNFAVLPIVALKNVEFRGLNAHEFFDVFFADDAPFGFPAFHILRRDKEVQYSSWNTGVTSDKPIPPSITTKEREVQYHAKTNSFLGPAYAPTKKIQRAYFVSKKMLVIEIRMTLHDIPFSKQFYLIERWIIDGNRTGGTPSSSNTKSKNQQSTGSTSPKAFSSHCVYLTVSSEVYFTQECPFENAVRKESTKQVFEISKCWNVMAQAGLKRTEETRRKRLAEKERVEQLSPTSKLQNELEGDESIEIEFLESGNRRVGGRMMGRFNKRRSSSNDQIQYQSQFNRRKSKPFSKLLARGGNQRKKEERHESLLKSSPAVRISSARIPSC